VYRYLLARLRAAPDAEDLARDLCQEALIRAMGAISRSTFASDGRLLSWGLTIARNVLLDHLRETRGRAEVRGDGHWARAEAGGPLPGEEAPPPRLLEGVAAEVLAEVPETTAELLRLRLVGGRSWKEVAAALGIAESAAKRRFQRTQATLRRKILARLEALPHDAGRTATQRLPLPLAGRRRDGAESRSPGKHVPGERQSRPAPGPVGGDRAATPGSRGTQSRTD
jgi:RNA polymerase sigma factor (sigma-70 family)